MVRVVVDLFGSLALTGAGHGTHWAVELGLRGETPDTVDPDLVRSVAADDVTVVPVTLMGRHAISFDRAGDIVPRTGEVLSYHVNGLVFTALDSSEHLIDRRTYYSIGGGFVVDQDDIVNPADGTEPFDMPFPFSSCAELLEICERENMTIAEVALANETARRRNEDVSVGLRRIWSVMRDCMDRGLAADGTLPGKWHIRRRAKSMHAELARRMAADGPDPLAVLNWINLYALAVNEENAAGGRVVTAPTNGAAGVVPAVIRYYEQFCARADEAGIFRFLLTAAAIGSLYKRNASISGAEMGCQGEIGVACSMAAAGLIAALNGTNAQVENAAEIGMEHNLGLTCDPVGGLVQIPCIERNAMAAVKAINAAMIARNGDGRHVVSLDTVIETMRQTGADMMNKYKETSQGGLAVNVVEC